MSSLKTALANLITQVQGEVQQQTQESDPVAGTVASLNDDGTVNINVSDGTILQNVGAALPYTIGAQVIVITAGGVRSAVPYL